VRSVNVVLPVMALHALCPGATPMVAISAVVAVGAFIYLVFAIVRPERF
jgi:K+-transporting ATPase KdpF subunit